MQSEAEIRKTCDLVRETAFAIHKYFRSGHLEKVYENALVHRLRKLGLHIEQQWPLKVFDEDGTPVGDYIADLIVEGFLVVELKATRSVADEHVAQILGYLRASRKEHGLLINFGAQTLYLHQKVCFVRRTILLTSCAFSRLLLPMNSEGGETGSYLDDSIQGVVKLSTQIDWLGSGYPRNLRHSFPLYFSIRVQCLTAMVDDTPGGGSMIHLTTVSFPTRTRKTL